MTVMMVMVTMKAAVQLHGCKRWRAMVGSDGADDDDAAPLFFDMAACTAVRRTRTRTAYRLARMIGSIDHD